MISLFLFFHAEDGIRLRNVTAVQTCALPILLTVLTSSRTRPIFLGGYTTSEPLFDPKLCLFSVVRLLQQRTPPVIWSFVTTPTSPSAFLPDPGKRGNPNRHRRTF